MHPEKVVRDQIVRLTDLPNVGKAMARDLALLGIGSPQDLAGKDPLDLYRSLCRKTRTRQDPCVLDVFISIIRFVGGEPAQSWWAYTPERRRLYGALQDNESHRRDD